MKFKLLLATLLSVLPLAAQDAPAVSAHIDFVSWSEDLEGVTAGSNNKQSPVSVMAFRYSEPLKYNGPATLSVYWDPSKAPADPAPAPDADAATEAPKIPDDLAKRRQKEPTLAAIIPLPAGTSQITVLLAPGPQKSLRFYTLDDDPSRFPFGKIKVHNFSLSPVAVAFNKDKLTPLKYQDTLMAPIDAQGSVTYQLSYQKENKWKPQENNILHVDPTEQMHFVILQSNASFFRSSDGSKGGKLQTVTLRRQKPAQ